MTSSVDFRFSAAVRTVAEAADGLGRVADGVAVGTRLQEQVDPRHPVRPAVPRRVQELRGGPDVREQEGVGERGHGRVLGYVDHADQGERHPASVYCTTTGSASVSPARARSS